MDSYAVNDLVHILPSIREGRFDYRQAAEAAYLEPAACRDTRAWRCAFTLRYAERYAGRSGESFNLSFDRGAELDVFANRRRLLKAMGQATLCSVRQVHGNAVCVVDDHALARGLAGVSADALVTALPNVPIGVLAADCLPIILYSSRPRALAVVHAGRMGTYHRVVLETLSVMQQRFAVVPSQIQAMMGPAIGGCCYHLDHRAIDPFRERFPDWETYCLPHGPDMWTMDLVRANRGQLTSAGVPERQIESVDMCTVCHHEHVFSHRAEGASAGRGMGVAVLSHDPLHRA